MWEWAKQGKAVGVLRVFVSSVYGIGTVGVAKHRGWVRKRAQVRGRSFWWR